MKKIKRSIWIVSAAGAAVLVLAVIVSALLAKNSVEHVNPRYGPIIESIYGLGKVKTDRVYEVKLGITKTLEKLYVHEGDIVRKKSPLVKFEGGLLFRAPFHGTVTNVAFNENQYVFPQQTVVRVEDLGTKYIEVSLEQQGALRVQPGQQVRVVFESIRGEVLQGKVAAIFSRNEEFLAHIEVPLAGNILPGMTADVAIEVDRKDNALLVPLSAISDGRIKLIRDGKRKTMQLKIGSVDGNWAEVVEGDVKVNDRILVQRQLEKKQ